MKIFNWIKDRFRGHNEVVICNPNYETNCDFCHQRSLIFDLVVFRNQKVCIPCIMNGRDIKWFDKID